MTRDIEYGRAGETVLRLDASTPDGEGPFPVAVVVHGGGWSSGDKAADPAPVLAALTEARVAWVSINYRLAPAARWPACLEDVNAAVRWVKSHAQDVKGDPERVALVGYSAGGQLACMAAVTATDQTRVQAVVGIAPPTDLELDLPQRGGLSESLQKLLGRPHELTDDARRQLREISAVHFVRAGLPPFLLVHGTADKSVPYAGSVAFAAALKRVGVACELVTLEGAPHRLSEWGKFDAGYAGKIAEWVRETLRAGGSLKRPRLGGR